MTPHDVTRWVAIGRLALAFALALPLGWDREHRSRSPGLRVHPLLAACTCGFLLLPLGVAWGVGAQADVFYGLVSGIGFVASGAVLKSSDGIRGMSTAASLWVTGAVGAGVAYGVPQLSAALTLLSLVALRAPSALVERRGAS
jgi:putative Mg2+ transporter-C (MgtC) family protein